jgi:hypothetical protein
MVLPAPRPRARCDEFRQIGRSNTYGVVDAHVRKVSVLADLVNGPRADREMLGDLGNPK